MSHEIHLTGGDTTPFLAMFQGECALCHKLDARSGAWATPSGPQKQAGPDIVTRSRLPVPAA